MDNNLLFEFGLKYLQYGLLGFGLFLAILSFVLIVFEARRSNPRDNILKQIRGFRQFALFMTALGLMSSIIPNIIPNQQPLYEIVESSPYAKEDLDYDSAYLAFQEEQYLPEISEDVTFYKDSELWEYIESNANHIEDLYISGAHLMNGVGRIISSIKTVLQNDGRVRILLTDPSDTTVINYQSQRKNPPHLFNQIQSNILGTLSELTPLTELGDLIVKTTHFPLDERMHVINPRSPNGLLYLKVYPYMEARGVEFGGLYYFFDQEGEKDSLMFEHYLKKFMNLYANGSNINLTSESTVIEEGMLVIDMP